MLLEKRAIASLSAVLALRRLSSAIDSMVKARCARFRSARASLDAASSASSPGKTSIRDVRSCNAGGIVSGLTSRDLAVEHMAMQSIKLLLLSCVSFLLRGETGKLKGEVSIGSPAGGKRLTMRVSAAISFLRILW